MQPIYPIYRGSHFKHLAYVRLSFLFIIAAVQDIMYGQRAPPGRRSPPPSRGPPSRGGGGYGARPGSAHELTSPLPRPGSRGGKGWRQARRGSASGLQAINAFRKAPQAGEVFIGDLPAAFRPLLKPLDHSGDGILTVAEFKAAMDKYEHSTGNKAVFPIDAFPDALQDLMRPLDLDDSGTITLVEFSAAMKAFENSQKQNRRLWQALGVFLVIFVILMVAIGILTSHVVESAKENKVESTGRMTVKTNTTSDDSAGETMVQTENPKSYATLLDLPMLPLEAINSLEELTFTTSDGALHSYKKSGVKIVSGTQLEIFFVAFGRSLVIDSATNNVEFVVEKPSGLTPTRTAVQTSAAAAVRRRRRALHAEPHRRLHERCLGNGACLHTFEEILHLHGHDPAAALGDGAVAVDAHAYARRLTDGRRLPEADNADTSAGDSLGYATVAADGVSLMSGKSALTRADNYMQQFTGSGAEVGDDERNKLVFNFRDRCRNYAGLSNCDLAVPTASEGSDAVGTAAPYAGLVQVDGVWYFHDEVTYEKDANTMKLTIRYAHDSQKTIREHVIMMSTDGTRYFQYDNETIDSTSDEGPDTVSVLARCTSIAPNDSPTGAVTTEEADTVTPGIAPACACAATSTECAAAPTSATVTCTVASVPCSRVDGTPLPDDRDGGNLAFCNEIPASTRRRRLEGPRPSAARRRMSIHELQFHAHVRTKLKGFGVVHIGRPMRRLRRRLQAADGEVVAADYDGHADGTEQEDDEEVEITLEPEVSTAAPKGLVDVESEEAMAELFGDGDAAAGRRRLNGEGEDGSYEAVYGAGSVALTTATALTGVTDAEEPLSIFGSPTISVLNGTIAWPTMAECVQTSSLHAIPVRNNLDEILTNAEAFAAQAGVTDAEADLPEDGKRARRALDEADFFWEEARHFPRTRNDYSIFTRPDNETLKHEGEPDREADHGRGGGQTLAYSEEPPWANLQNDIDGLHEAFAPPEMDEAAQREALKRLNNTMHKTLRFGDISGHTAQRRLNHDGPPLGWLDRRAIPGNRRPPPRGYGHPFGLIETTLAERLYGVGWTWAKQLDGTGLKLAGPIKNPPRHHTCDDAETECMPTYLNYHGQTAAPNSPSPFPTYFPTHRAQRAIAGRELEDDGREGSAAGPAPAPFRVPNPVGNDTKRKLYSTPWFGGHPRWTEYPTSSADATETAATPTAYPTNEQCNACCDYTELGITRAMTNMLPGPLGTEDCCFNPMKFVLATYGAFAPPTGMTMQHLQDRLPALASFGAVTVTMREIFYASVFI